MDDVDSRDFETKDFGSEDLDEMTVYGDMSAVSPDIKPVPFNDDTDDTKAKSAAQPVGPVKKRPAQKTTPSERITGIKTFFTKLHPGAMDFLDEQIANWLKANPGIIIKRTNTMAGEVQGKKTEPNIIITVWY